MSVQLVVLAAVVGELLLALLVGRWLRDPEPAPARLGFVSWDAGEDLDGLWREHRRG